MPTLNEYADEDGYYILARPSDTGNITYQLKPRGEQIVEKVGYQDGEEIGWQVISALKIPNLVYTGDEGAINNDTAVDLDKEEIDALNKEDAKQLLDELSAVPRVGDSQADKIQEILEVPDETGVDLGTLVGEISAEIEEQGMVDDRALEGQKKGTISMWFMSSSSRLQNETIIIGQGIPADFEIKLVCDTTVEFKNDSQSDENGFFILRIYLSDGHGVAGWNLEMDTFSMSNKTILKCREIMTDMLPIAISKIESAEIRLE